VAMHSPASYHSFASPPASRHRRTCAGILALIAGSAAIVGFSFTTTPALKPEVRLSATLPKASRAACTTVRKSTFSPMLPAVQPRANAGMRNMFEPRTARHDAVRVNVMVPKEKPNVGVPSLSSANFTLKQMIGQMRPTDTPGDNTKRNNNSLVNFFSATGRSQELTGQEEEIPLLLKEYRGDAKKMALRELAVQARLRGSHADASRLPVLPILGTFESKCIVHMTENGFSFGDKSLWTVENLNGITDTLVSYPYFPQKQQLSDKLPIIGPEMFLRRREAYIRKVIKGMVLALQEIHNNGIAHSALDMTSILVSTFDETKIKELKVHLGNFGYAVDTMGGEKPDPAFPQQLTGAAAAGSLLRSPEEAALTAGRGELETEAAIRAARKDDLYRAGLVMAELVYGAMSPEGPNARTHSSFIERRLRFKGFNVEGLREWSLEPSWTLVVDFLDKDDRAGWDFLQHLVKPASDMSSDEIIEKALKHRFLKENTSPLGI